MKPFPFQQATVDAAVARLGGRGRRRFLVADEVGLGKTVVAREVIRKLSGGGSKRFTVYYVTSNTKVFGSKCQEVGRLPRLCFKISGIASRQARAFPIGKAGQSTAPPPARANHIFRTARCTASDWQGGRAGAYLVAA